MRSFIRLFSGQGVLKFLLFILTALGMLVLTGCERQTNMTADPGERELSCLLSGFHSYKADPSDV